MSSFNHSKMEKAFTISLQQNGIEDFTISPQKNGKENFTILPHKNRKEHFIIFPQQNEKGHVQDNPDPDSSLSDSSS